MQDPSSVLVGSSLEPAIRLNSQANRSAPRLAAFRISFTEATQLQRADEGLK